MATNKKPLQVVVKPAVNPENPLEDTGARVISFNPLHSNYMDPADALEGYPPVPGQNKIFVISCHIHGETHWMPHTPVGLDQLDHKEVAGLFVSEKDTTKDEIQACLDLYNMWINGHVFYVEVYKPVGSYLYLLDSCSGLYELDPFMRETFGQDVEYEEVKEVNTSLLMEDSREAHAAYNNRLLNRLIQVGSRVLLKRWDEIQVRVYDEGGNNVSAGDNIDNSRGGEFMHMDCALHKLICWDSGVLDRMTVHIPTDKMDNASELKRIFDETESINVEILSL